MRQQPEEILPPKWADRFLEWYCYKPLFDSIYGDLQERFDEYLERYGERRARRKYWLECIPLYEPAHSKTLKLKCQQL